MENLDDILNAAVEKIGEQSDRQLAIKLGVGAPTVSNWRHKRSTPDAYALMELQKILQIDARELLAIIEAERAKTEERRGYWEEMKKSFSKKGTVTALALAALIMLASTPQLAEASEVVLRAADTANVYYVKLRRRAKALVERLSTMQISLNYFCGRC